MRYLAGNRVPIGVIRRYVRAVLAEKSTKPLDLPRMIHSWPTLLRAVEPLPGDTRTLLRRRLSIATRIVEMTPAAAPPFHNYKTGTRVMTALSLAWNLGTEVLLFPIRMLFSRLKRPRS